MRTRALFASVTASAGLLVGGWQLGAQAVPDAVAISDTTSTPSTGTTSSGNSGTTGSGSTGSGSGTTGSGSTGSGASGATGTGTTSGSSATSPAPAAQEPSGQAASGSYTGSTATERFGTVTVKVTVADGKITDVSADMTARDSRSQQINTRAAALLRTEVLSAQSADVTMISGATYTSDAYLTSLQAALDQAGL
ncbi:MAG: FMN-binding domain protein [Micrococcaceae bacterium]|nr:FMN-binding domain protein [Micrococcaceae bacterium]